MPATPALRAGAVAALTAVVALGAACSSGSSTDAAPSTTAGTGSTAGAATGSTAAPTGTTVSETCTIDAAVPRGEVLTQTFPHDGLDRQYMELVPTGAGDQRLPLVIDIHGYAEGMGVHVAHTRLDATAEQEGFLYVSPDGTGEPRYWNFVGADQGADDLGYLSALIDHEVAARCADPRRVYVTGLSNGAFMSSAIGCVLADKVAAIGPVAGLTRLDACDPARPIPVMAFHGGEDTYVLLEGGLGADANELPNVSQLLDLAGQIEFPSVRDSAAAFAADNECATGPTTTTPVEGVEQITWTDCAEGADVVLYITPQSGHVWPGSEFEATISSVTGTPNDRLDANALLWEFFQRFSLPA